MPSRTLTPGDGMNALAQLKLAWEKREPDRLLAFVAADAEYRYDPFEPPLIGANAIREHWNQMVAEQAHVEFDAERVWVVGQTVLASYHAAYTRRVSAERVRERGFVTIELDDDLKVQRLRQWSVSRDVGTDSGFKPETAPGEEGAGQHG